jgi:hypothetical protein
VARYEQYRDRYRHVLRCDIWRYFPAIDHEILKAEFRRRIGCAATLALMDAIVDGSNAQEPARPRSCRASRRASKACHDENGRKFCCMQRGPQQRPPWLRDRERRAQPAP